MPVRPGVSVDADGMCDERFSAVKDAFEANFEKGVELGAAVAVVHRDELVVDLWGGYADVSETKPWQRDTLVMVASTSKVVASIVGLMLIDRGLVELDAPISRYWPEFGAAGKESIPVRFIFCHATGVAGFDPVIPIEQIHADWDAAVVQLASQAPWWEPGTRNGYHALTYGYLLGELCRRTTGSSYADFVRDELAAPLGIDFTIGVPVEDRRRVAELFSPHKRAFEGGPDSISHRAEWGMSANVVGSVPELWLDGLNPSSTGFTDPRAIATLGSVVSNGGTWQGQRFMSEDTAALVWQEQRYEKDLVMGDPVRWGMGFGLPSNEIPLPFPRAFHWGGYGGSVFVADPDSRTAWCYAPNRFDPDRMGDPRGFAIGGAAIRCIQAL